jgi:mRNA-degrading endonuclease RelE of RelBE toxin-antitoxin system
VLTVIETPVYLVWVKQVWFDEDERVEFVNWIAANPEAGNVIEDTGNLRKVRWARKGMGKRGGARVIYFLRRKKGEVVLLLVYAKSKYDNLRPEFLRKLKESYEDEE